MTLITTNLNEALERHLRDYPHPQRVDVISSYIRKEGMDVVWPVFKALEEQGAKIRIISTFNRKITDIDSVERLAKLKNTEVYIFEPSQVNFHAKSWSFGYADRDLDTAIIGSSNLTGRGVAAAVEWNVLLQRRKHRDASGAIDHAAQQFDWYLKDPNFRMAFIKWDLNMTDYQGFRAEMHRYLATDQELIQQATPKVRRRWEELNAEVDQLRQAERNKVQLGGPPLRARSPGGWEDLPLPRNEGLIFGRVGINPYLYDGTDPHLRSINEWFIQSTLEDPP
jgi:HKD family nuclease